MNAAAADPFIYLLMSPEDHARAQADGVWDKRKKGEAFIHASPADQLTRVANKHYAHLEIVHVVWLQADRIRSRIEWEPAGDGLLYPHIFGPINFDAEVKHLAFAKGPDGKFAIVL